MRRISVSFSEQQLRIAEQKAVSLGLTTAAYIRNALKESFSYSDIDRRHQETLRAIRGLVPVLADGFGRAQRSPREVIDQLSKVLLERYAQVLNDKEV